VLLQQQFTAEHYVGAMHQPGRMPIDHTADAAQAPMSGEYKITMSIGPSAVGNSPYRVPCQQPRPSDVESVVDLRNGHGFVDEPYTAVVTVRDQFGRRQAKGEMAACRAALRVIICSEIACSRCHATIVAFSRLRSFQERARVTASVVDIESDAHTVLFPATVSDRGSGNYKVRWPRPWVCQVAALLLSEAVRLQAQTRPAINPSFCNRRCHSNPRSRPPMGWPLC
jgi:hypothetical protein